MHLGLGMSQTDLMISLQAMVLFWFFLSSPFIQSCKAETRESSCFLPSQLLHPTCHSLIHWPLIFLLDLSFLHLCYPRFSPSDLHTAVKMIVSKQKYANVQHLLGAVSGLEWPEPGVPGEARAGEETREVGWDVGQWKSLCCAQSINMEGIL